MLKRILFVVVVAKLQTEKIAVCSGHCRVCSLTQLIFVSVLKLAYKLHF